MTVSDGAGATLDPGRARADARPPEDPAMRLGIVGCGNVSGDYFTSCATHPQLEIVACADASVEAAERQAARYQIARVEDPAQLVADPEVDLVVNLTPAAVHADVTLAAIAAGKHVFTEKPLAPTLEIAKRIVAAADAANVEVGCAPATFLGGGLQTCRKVIDDGWIGEPVAATAFVSSRGYEHWHPHPEPFYGAGGGPMLDVGPYWITALLHLLGPATRVCASTKRFAEMRRRPTTGGDPLEIPVHVATHAAGTIDFAAGPMATVMASWEIWATRLPYLEVYGTEGTLSVPNPNSFGGTPALRRGEPEDFAQVPTPPSGGSWHPLPLTHRGDVGRGIAIAEMADALRRGRRPRASAELAYHALEVMLAFERSSDTGGHVEVRSSCERPAPLSPAAPGWPVRFEP
jgi:predicted dehydrogenase